MRRTFTLLAALLLGALGAWVGLRLATREHAPQPAEQASHEPLPEPSFTRRVAPGLDDEDAALPEPAAPQPPTRDLAARWTRLNRMAIRALDAGDPARAVALFEQCVKGVPDEPVFRRNLAEALVRRAVARRERERPCPSCVEDLARAVELAPEREDLPRLLERWRAELEIEEGFWRESSTHFDLAYDGDRSDVLHGSHRLLEELEQAYLDLSELFGHLPVERGRPRFQVVLYRREGFDTLTGLGDWAGGAFDGTLRIPLEDLAREERALRSVLRHELVHAFVLEVGGPGVPGWLNEGLAQWLEPGREAAVQRARAALGSAELFDLGDLAGSLSRWEDELAIARAYAQSLLLVDHIAGRYGERVPFAMVEGCRAGTSPADTFRALTRLPLETVLGDLDRER